MSADAFQRYLRFFAPLDDDGNQAIVAFMQSCRDQFTLSKQAWLFDALQEFKQPIYELEAIKFLPLLKELVIHLISSISLSTLQEETAFYQMLVFFSQDGLGEEARTRFLAKVQDEMRLAQQPWIINCIHNLKKKRDGDDQFFNHSLREIGVALLLANDKYARMTGKQIYTCYDFISNTSINCADHVQALLQKMQSSNVAFNVVVDFLVHIKHSAFPNDLIFAIRELLLWAWSRTEPSTINGNDMIRLLVWLAEMLDDKMVNAMEVLVQSIALDWNLVTAILDDPRIRRAIQRGNRPLVELCRERIDSLNLKARPPKFSWSIPLARHDNPTMQTFLRGSDQSLMVTHQFNGIGQARDLVQRFTRDKRSSAYFNATVSGSGKYTKVTITKTRAHHDNMVTECRKAKDKMVELQALMVAAGNKRAREEDAISSSNQQDKRTCPSSDANTSQSSSVALASTAALLTQASSATTATATASAPNVLTSNNQRLPSFSGSILVDLTLN
jgi:hypothetical protein